MCHSTYQKDFYPFLSSKDVVEKQSELRQRWANLGALADEKRDALNSTFAIQTFHIEVKETIIWIRDKTTLIQSTEELGTGMPSYGDRQIFTYDIRFLVDVMPLLTLLEDGPPMCDGRGQRKGMGSRAGDRGESLRVTAMSTSDADWKMDA